MVSRCWGVIRLVLSTTPSEQVFSDDVRNTEVVRLRELQQVRSIPILDLPQFFRLHHVLVHLLKHLLKQVPWLRLTVFPTEVHIFVTTTFLLHSLVNLGGEYGEEASSGGDLQAEESSKG